jgi:hypothetical protein
MNYIFSVQTPLILADNQALFALGSYKSAFITGVPPELPTEFIRTLVESFGALISLDRWVDEVLCDLMIII